MTSNTEQTKRYIYGGLVTSDSPRVHAIIDKQARKIISIHTHEEMLAELERLNSEDNAKEQSNDKGIG